MADRDTFQPVKRKLLPCKHTLVNGGLMCSRPTPRHTFFIVPNCFLYSYVLLCSINKLFDTCETGFFFDNLKQELNLLQTQSTTFGANFFTASPTVRKILSSPMSSVNFAELSF